MTGPHPDAAAELRFLTVLGGHIDNWFADDANLDDLDQARALIHRRITALTTHDSPDTGTGGGAAAVLATELHRLRASRTRTTITTRAAHIHQATVRAVHARYTVLGVGPSEVLLPLEFIESVTRPGQENHA
ncbi:hypothetical protein GV791_09610 [Nocardia cyriacigeorgica]|uniref:Uncharacterized protein n=1 Tax=Nocardia cyriacigeorgica TaxID=135487 RepID=A0A6P1CLQ9_9NOCA|nr:hypothetical protein [Nocardia cyriacigeorgica]NEW32817.1 hypothetical protein [Nocardia cyriacigeorgica]